MTALYLFACALCVLSAVIILNRPTTRSNALALLLVGLAGQAFLFTPAAELVDDASPNLSSPLGDVLFCFSILMLFFWLKPGQRRTASVAFAVVVGVLAACAVIDGSPFPCSKPLAFGGSVTGTVYSFVYSAFLAAGAILLMRLRPVHSVRISRVAIGLLRVAGVGCFVYVLLRVGFPFLPDMLDWTGVVLRIIAALGIVLFAGAIIFAASATTLYNWRVQSGVDNLIRKKFGGRTPNGGEEYLYLRGPLGRTSDTIVNAATYYPTSFPALGGRGGVPLRRLLMYLRVFG